MKILAVSMVALVTITATLSGQPIYMSADDLPQIDTMMLDGEDTLLVEVEIIRGLAPFRDSLNFAVDSMAMSVARINEDQSARRALEPYEQRELNSSVDGYRVGVYFNNSAQARSGAMDVMQRCDSLLTDIPATMSYDNPYFKVSVGYCTSEEEAVIMLNRVQRYFPKAYLMRERITADNIIESRERELSSREVDPEMMVDVE